MTLQHEYMMYVADDIIEKGSSKETPENFVVGCAAQGNFINRSEMQVFLIKFYTNERVEEIITKAGEAADHV